MPVRRRQPRPPTTAAAERYQEIGIAAALSRPWDYPTACGELAAVLRLAYAALPKAAQALAVRDALLAFRLLPDVQTGYAVSAANFLLQAVEATLPKQKKALAVSEFKHSIVANKRRAKTQQESGSPHIPHDVLVHVFSFLDMRSLVAAGFVCWYFLIGSIFYFQRQAYFLLVTLVSSLEGLGIQQQMTIPCGRHITLYSLIPFLRAVVTYLELVVCRTTILLLCREVRIQWLLIPVLAGRRLSVGSTQDAHH